MKYTKEKAWLEEHGRLAEPHPTPNPFGDVHVAIFRFNDDDDDDRAPQNQLSSGNHYSKEEALHEVFEKAKELLYPVLYKKCQNIEAGNQ